MAVMASNMMWPEEIPVAEMDSSLKEWKLGGVIVPDLAEDTIGVIIETPGKIHVLYLKDEEVWKRITNHETIRLLMRHG